MMSREQPCLGEASPPASSSKNVKDKNNSSTVEALHELKEESNGRSCSEKDSGFSDNSSDSKHLDEKDECNKKQQREAKDESSLNHNEPRKKSNRRNVIVTPKQLKSFYIIKNNAQPDSVQKKHAQVLWSSGAMPSVSGTNPIILLQPSPSPQFSKSQGKSKNEATTKKINAANVPGISYPRIAPRPHKKTTSNGESLNQSKRVCIESNNTQANTNTQDIHKLDPSTSQPTPTSIASVPSTQSSSTASTSSTSELNKNSVINTRHRRFFNTVQVLKKSGLWDMTLRTKELMRQSNATKREIAQLKQHSDLLCQLTSSPNNQTASNESEGTLFDLHKSMAESGKYPGLKDIKDLQVQNKQQDESVEKPLSVKNGDGGHDDKDNEKGSTVVSDAANVTSDPTPEQTNESTEDPKTSNENQPEKTNPGGSSDD